MAKTVIHFCSEEECATACNKVWWNVHRFQKTWRHVTCKRCLAKKPKKRR